VIFVDTSFWVALRNRRDANHAPAEQLLEQRSSTPLLTTNHVRGETWTYLRRRAGHRAAVDFLEVIDRSPRIRVTHVAEEIETEALRWLRRRDDREYSFVDATSFALMRFLRITEALTFDQDFAAAGFIVAT
jgi:predicted nucleic acid-binding protein